jgi:hypothetical protein
MKMAGIRHPSGRKPRSQFKTGHARHANVGDHAGGFVSGLWSQELPRETEAERGQPARFDPILQCTLNRFVVVDDCHES